MRPQSNGQVERFHRTLGALLSIYTGEQPKLWDRHLPFVLGAYRAAQHDTTGMTPNYVMFGKEVRLPLPVVMGNPNERSGTNAEDYATEMKLRFERAFEITRRCLKGNIPRISSYTWLFAKNTGWFVVLRSNP